MTGCEDFVTEVVLKGRPTIGLYPANDPQTVTDFAAWPERERPLSGVIGPKDRPGGEVRFGLQREGLRS